MLVVAVPLGAGGGRGAAVVCRLELHSECGLANRPEAAPGVLGAEFLYVDADEVVRGACHLSAEFVRDLGWALRRMNSKGSCAEHPVCGRCRWCRCWGVGVGAGGGVSGGVAVLGDGPPSVWLVLLCGRVLPHEPTTEVACLMRFMQHDT